MFVASLVGTLTETGLVSALDVFVPVGVEVGAGVVASFDLDVEELTEDEEEGGAASSTVFFSM